MNGNSSDEDSNSSFSTIKYLGVAQQVEYPVWNREVVGSNPATLTTHTMFDRARIGGLYYEKII